MYLLSSQHTVDGSHTSLHINAIACTCQVLVQRDSCTFCQYLGNSWDRRIGPVFHGNQRLQALKNVRFLSELKQCAEL